MQFWRLAGGTLLLLNSGLCAKGFADTEPVACWDFAEGRDSHVHDSSGNGNHGLARGTAWLEIGEHYALEFLKNDALVNCGNGAALDITGAITLEAWVFPSAPAESETGIAGKSFSTYGLTFYSDGNVYWYIGSGGNKCAAPLPAREWAHLVGTFDGRVMNLYVNGDPADTTKSEFESINHGGDFLIGCIAKGGYTQSFKGAIGEVCVYDSALSADEVKERFEAGERQYPGPPPKYDHIVVRPYCYPDSGRIVLDGDFCSVYPLKEGEEVVAEVRMDGQDEALQRHTLPPIPRTGLLRDVELDVGALEPGDYELRVGVERNGKVRSDCTVPFSYAKRMGVPSPGEHAVPPIPDPPGVPESVFELGEKGGFSLVIDGDTYAVESTYSYPHGGDNALLANNTAAATQPEDSWQVEAERVDARTCRVVAQGTFYSINRLIERTPGRLLVKDTITNTSGAELGIMLSNGIDTSRVDGLIVTNFPNPSVFTQKQGVGVGIVALDDVYLEQHETFGDAKVIGIRTSRFGLETGASYTLEWAVYTTTGGYYDFINAVRRDEGYLPFVEGGFAFTDRREPPSAEYVEARALRYASIGCLGHPPDDPGLSLEGVEFMEYPQECALLKETFAETHRRYPGMKVMFHIAHSLYTCNDPETLFPDSRVLNAAGVQTDYGSQNVSYYAKYFSNERVEEGYRWYIFYPTRENTFGKYMLDAIDYMLDEIGANAMFADGYTHGYGGRFTYDRWDGHTVEIDPETKTITRKLASVNLLAQDALIDVCRKVEAAGGVVIANSYPGTRSVHKENILYCLETAAGGKVCSRLHLAPSVIALGNPGNLNSDRDVYEDIRDKLEWGGLYFYYGEKNVAPDTIVTRMYPITVKDINAGTIKGQERIITLRPGVYGWREDESRRLHLVHHYDGRGVPVSHDFLTCVDQSGARTEVLLGEGEAAVLERIPIHIESQRPVNVVVQQYNHEGMRLAIAGEAECRLTCRSGAFPLEEGRGYAAIVNEQRRELHVRDESLTFSFVPGSPSLVSISAQRNPE